MKSFKRVIEFFLISQIRKIEPVKIKTAEVEEEEGGRECTENFVPHFH
jgi:hypothetical protein